MFITINSKSSTPLYEQVVEQLKEMIAKGIVKEDEKLPSVRELASQIVLNPNTVSKAYKELERQGVIVTIRGRGTFVAEAKGRTVDPKLRQTVQNQLKKLIVEASYAGIKKEEFMIWVQDEFESMEGVQNDS